MRIVQYYSHLNGFEYLQYHRPHIWEDLSNIIASVDAERCRTKNSEESRKLGRKLYSPVEMNKEFADLFRKYNWSERRVINWVAEDTSILRDIIRLCPEDQKK